MDREHMVLFVRNFLESHDPIATSLESIYKYPFRRRFEHCLRCSVWAKRIAMAENADVELVEISALFHDIGKPLSNSEQDHGQVGAEICDRYLSSVGYNTGRRSRIVRITRDHSLNARSDKASLEEKVVSDADLLDEVGAITVLWDAMACALKDDAPSYDKVYDRIGNALTRLKNNLSGGQFHTPTANRIVEGRLEFLDDFLINLGYELGRIEL